MRTDSLAFVSVIVPIRNEARDVGHCLQALRTQSYPSDHLEIICAEGSSTDGTRGLIERAADEDTRIRIVDNPSGRTPDALNAALAAARGQVIVRMDAHAIPRADYVANCVAALDRTGAWCVGGRMLKDGETSTSSAIAAASSSRFGVGDSTFHYAASPQFVESVFLGAWPRWVFEKLGGFDPDLPRNQDDELSYRIRKAGGRIWFDPAISVRYRTRDSFRSLFEQHRQYGFWKIRVFQKHPGAARWRHFVPAALVGSVVAGILGRGIPGLRRTATIGIGAYVVATFITASRIAGSKSELRALDVAKAFAAMHFGYGIGFWQGALRFLPMWGSTRIGRHGSDDARSAKQITRGNP
jgi:succinoglycan biosynthesis protein ExoA